MAIIQGYQWTPTGVAPWQQPTTGTIPSYIPENMLPDLRETLNNPFGNNPQTPSKKLTPLPQMPTVTGQGGDMPGGYFGADPGHPFYDRPEPEARPYAPQVPEYVPPAAGSGFDLGGGLPNMFQPDKFHTSETNSYSGLPADIRNQLLGFAMPQLQASVEGLPGVIDAFRDKSNEIVEGMRGDIDKYSGMSQQQLQAAKTNAEGRRNLFLSDTLGTLSGIYTNARQDFRQNIENARGNIPVMLKEATTLYERMSRQAIEGAMQPILNDLASRNVINSSMMGDAIQKATREIVPTFANKGYEAAILAAQMRYNLDEHEADSLLAASLKYADLNTTVRTEAEKMLSNEMSDITGYESQFLREAMAQSGKIGSIETTLAEIAARMEMSIPGLLADIVNMGRYTESSGLTQDPLQPYELMAKVLLNL
jgi:hypothetical protein